ncbi:hypothetical protein L9F63_001995, partial [Diploptera punctata]
VFQCFKSLASFLIHYRGSMKSLNTGIVTLLNYGKHVPPAVSHVTLAHEIGHNFGSPHDPDLCTPGGEDGNFIMFARATSGDKKNNNKFSPCSLNSINPVLNAKARSPKGCFTEPQAAICGNGVVETGEECDCGWEEDCRDNCCFPQRRYPPTEEPPCKLTPRSTCSPSQEFCENTELYELKFGDKCRDDNGCRDASFCDGRGPQCPPSINKPNKTICNEELVCFMGECTGSICLAFGLESCQCIPGPHDSKTKACELCCKLPGDDQPCLSSFDWNSPPYDMPNLFSKPGTPCNDYNGYCDVFQKCREVDPSGPLATLRKLLLSDESIASFKRWVTDHWYAVLLIVFAILFILVVSTKFLGKRPNLKLKNVTIIHSSTTETVRLPPEGEGGQVTIHPAAVRSKLPLKRKVREKQRMHRHRMKVKDAANNNNNNNNNNATPKKVVNKKKRKKKLGAAVPEEDATKHSGEAAEEAALQRKLKKAKQQTNKVKKKKKKEVIDYSAVQGEKDKLGLVLGLPDKTPLSDNDPVGKVKNWLLTSQHPVDSSLIPKSKSTPIGLTGSAESPVKTRTSAIVHHSRAEKPKSRSTGNLQGANKNGEKEKLRLQVVYKPPFKFSLKLRKAEKGAGATSSVVVVERSHRRSVPTDRKRNGPRNAVLLKTRDHKRTANSRKTRAKDTTPITVSPTVTSAPNQLTAPSGNQSKDHEVDIDSNIQTYETSVVHQSMDISSPSCSWPAPFSSTRSTPFNIFMALHACTNLLSTSALQLPDSSINLLAQPLISPPSRWTPMGGDRNRSRRCSAFFTQKSRLLYDYPHLSPSPKANGSPNSCPICSNIPRYLSPLGEVRSSFTWKLPRIPLIASKYRCRWSSCPASLDCRGGGRRSRREAAILWHSLKLGRITLNIVYGFGGDENNGSGFIAENSGENGRRVIAERHGAHQQSIGELRRANQHLADQNRLQTELANNEVQHSVYRRLLCAHRKQRTSQHHDLYTDQDRRSPTGKSHLTYCLGGGKKLRHIDQ